MTWMVRETTWAESREALSEVRRSVFIEEQSVPESMEWDEAGAVAVHFLAVEQGQVVGTARLLPTGQIGRLAVLPTHRRQGIGSALLARAIQKAQLLGLGEVFLHAQLTALPLYQAFLFIPEGEVFDEAGIAHQFMRRPLTK
ncbi:MAG: GNAT family N-acetyltransferase [Thiotrichales bacterium]